MTPVAKVKIKDRHRNVAAHFRKWKTKNPDAPLDEQVKALDFFADTAKLHELTQ